MKVLMVLTSHDRLGDTGRKTGFWLEELAAPYYVFKDSGAEITLASPRGGRPPLDPKSNEAEFRTDLTRRFENDTAAEAQLDSTVRLRRSSATMPLACDPGLPLTAAVWEISSLFGTIGRHAARFGRYPNEVFGALALAGRSRTHNEQRQHIFVAQH